MLKASTHGQDYNFFTDLRADNTIGKNRAMPFIACLVVLICIVGAFFAFTEIKVYKAEKDILEAMSFLNSPDILKKRQEFAEKKTKFELMNKYYSSVEAASAEITNSDKVKSSFLQKVMNTVPKNVSFNTMAVTQNQLNIQGVSANRVSIAEFQHNLVSLGLFKEVFVSNIQKDTSLPDGSLYNIQCSLKDVIKP